jgi:ATP-binding protein involved in chromosome partitioning
VPFLGSVQLDPSIRQAGDSGKPAVLAGEESTHSKPLFEFTRRVVTRIDEIKSASTESVIQIQ